MSETTHGNATALRAAAILDIQKHLAEHGGKNWKDLIQKYVDQGVHEQTVWRWIRATRAKDAPRVELVAAKARIEGALDPEARGPLPPNAAELGRDLPVAPSPAYIAKHGERGMRNLDMLVELERLYQDGLLLRAYAMRIDRDPETGAETEKIKNPVIFEKQLQRRLNVLDTALKAMGEVWNLRQMQDFYEVVVQEIGRADPETQKRILQRLADLNARTGLSMAMRT